LGWLRRFARALATAGGALAAAFGGFGLALHSAPDTPGLAGLRDAWVEAAESIPALAERVPALLILLQSPPWCYAVLPAGLALAIAALLPGRSRAGAAAQAEPNESALLRHVDPATQKRAQREAKALARRGQHADAAELYFGVGLLEEAAGEFIRAEEFERAAEIRHDQNRFIESAELYRKAGKHESAGTIYAQQKDFAKAAEAYVEAGNTGVAAELFEQAGRHLDAARNYAEANFHRHAAQAYLRCDRWFEAAQSLERVIEDEGVGARSEQQIAEMRKLHRMAGNLYERAGKLDLAERILVRGGAHAAAAEIAERCGRHPEAVRLFLDAGQPERAAALLRNSGDPARAALVLAEHYRDRGQEELAAQHFEQGGDALAAAELYRSIGSASEAARCFEQAGDAAQAADLYAAAGDTARAAACYERSGHHLEAAECWALLGDSAREAEFLGRAGRYLRAAEIHRREGRTEEAIRLLQQVAPDSAENALASALLGEIFSAAGKHGLAIKKLEAAIGGQPLSPKNAQVYYQLGCSLEASGELRRAGEIFEGIQAFDYHHGDVAMRLERVRQALAAEEAAATNARVRAPTSASAPAAGAKAIGRYELLGELGRGGMGIVYKARDTMLDRVVALKVLPDTLKENPQALKNFLREAKAAAQLNHPGIVTIYDAGEQGGVWHIAMEFVDGSTLKQIVRQRGRIAAGGVVHVLLQLCEALAFAHDKKIVHRDIKTANVMWTHERKVKIMDFGLARVVEEVRNHTTVVSGTPYYMSPEQTLGRAVDPRTDLYSLGVTVFELATGKLPFTEGNLPYHHVHTPAPDPRTIVPDLPDALATVILRCLQKDPAHRYQSVRELLAELRRSSLARSRAAGGGAAPGGDGATGGVA
jgi:tetratricopeptide (TPR) repeat protein